MVRRAYELYAARAYSLKTLRKKLHEEGLATTKDGKRKPFDALVSAANHENGWGARIRTWDRGSKVLCLTTWPRPKGIRFAHSIGRLLRADPVCGPRMRWWQW